MLILLGTYASSPVDRYPNKWTCSLASFLLASGPGRLFFIWDLRQLRQLVGLYSIYDRQVLSILRGRRALSAWYLAR